MDKAVLILTVAIATYITRISGFILGQRTIPPIVDRFLNYVPVAVFAALITPNVGVGANDFLPRLLGVAVATIIVLRVKHLWAGLAGGMATYWLVHIFL